jgi:hypothetical protein
MSAWAYPSWVRVGPRTAYFQGAYYQYSIACTLADAWCGAIPLVWKLRTGVLQNLRYIAGLAFLVFALNTVRQAILNLLQGAGLSWKPVHDVLAAATYLVIWLVIVRRGAWREMNPSETLSHVEEGTLPVVKADYVLERSSTSAARPMRATISGNASTSAKEV